MNLLEDVNGHTAVLKDEMRCIGPRFWLESQIRMSWELSTTKLVCVLVGSS